jgi:hypothetical protein
VKNKTCAELSVFVVDVFVVLTGSPTLGDISRVEMAVY